MWLCLAIRDVIIGNGVSNIKFAFNFIMNIVEKGKRKGRSRQIRRGDHGQKGMGRRQEGRRRDRKEGVRREAGEL